MPESTPEHGPYATLERKLRRLVVGGCAAGAVLAFAPIGGAVVHPDPGNVIERSHPDPGNVVERAHPDPGSVVERTRTHVIRPMPGKVIETKRPAV
jgi:hypothetical protein